MRGDFDVNIELYPVGVSFAGINDVVVVNHLTGEEHAREELQPRGSDERKAQWARLTEQAGGLNQDIRASRTLPAGVQVGATESALADQPALITDATQLNGKGTSGVVEGGVEQGSTGQGDGAGYDAHLGETQS